METGEGQPRFFYTNLQLPAPPGQFPDFPKATVRYDLSSKSLGLSLGLLQWDMFDTERLGSSEIGHHCKLSKNTLTGSSLFRGAVSSDSGR